MIIIILLIVLLTGFFVIQPIGSVPQGITIWYLRANANLKLPFISSADGILLKGGVGVSLLSRGLMLSKVLEEINDKIILRFGYSHIMYKISTKGVEFEN